MSERTPGRLAGAATDTGTAPPPSSNRTVNGRSGRSRIAVCRAVTAVALCIPVSVFSAHPLITEDTGTQGRGRYQLELVAELGHEQEHSLHEDAFDRAAVLSYGVRDNVDVLLTVVHLRTVVQEDGVRTTERGLSDIGLDAKWRFFEKEEVSVAVKPGVIFPTGNEDKGLGAGKFSYSLFLVTSFENAPWGYHIHIGYVRNRNVHDERAALHHTSLALTYQAADDWRLVADLGNLTSPDKSFDEDASFLVLGAIYSVTENLDLDFGLKRGVSEPETDLTVLLGLAWRFGKGAPSGDP